MTRKLQDKAMLVHLQIRRWSARKHDRRISAEVARRHNTDEDAGRYNKQLLAKKHLEDVYLTSNRVRRFHYEKTLPWSDTGERILPAALHPEYTKTLRELKTKFEHEVSAFVAAYPQLVQEARFHLRGLFNSDDYPSAEEIGDKFEIDVAVTPVPSADDFRVDLQSSEVAQIREQIERRNERQEARAMREVWDRLFQVVEKMARTLSDPEAKFKNSLVGNVSELCEVLPKLNVSDDEKLDRMVDRVRSRLAGLDPDRLRHEPETRTRSASEARQIADSVTERMAAYTGGGSVLEEAAQLEEAA